jgi:rhamnosyltransferase
MNISVIIPSLNAVSMLESLVTSLRDQTTPPNEILVVDSESNDGTAQLAHGLGCMVLPIDRSDFNHGGTRNLASIRSQGDILVFMTQDALPVDPFFLQHLLDPILSGKTAASYARQVAYPNASVGEKFARVFNYPPVSQIRTRASIEPMGIGAYFFSNVSSAIRKDVFMDVGMFADDVIMNEDMLMCAKLLNAGHAVAYAAEAQVYHSHDYSLLQTFRRYFDIGVFFARHFSLSNLATNGRGAAYTRKLLAHMVKQGNIFAFFHAVGETCAKFSGFTLGKLERFIPLAVKQHLSMHEGFWESNTSRNKANLL